MIFTDANGARLDKFQARQQRRKANKVARNTGGLEFISNAGHTSVRGLDIPALEREAKAALGLRIRLTELNTVASRKARRALNDVWYNRNTATVQGAWDSTEAAKHNPLQVLK